MTRAHRFMLDLVRPVVGALTLPHGFTLTVGAALASTIAHRPQSGNMLTIWLFVVGGSLGFCLLALLTNATTSPAASDSPAQFSFFNLTPVLIVPLVDVITRWIPVIGLEYAAAGFLAVTLYVLAYSAVLIRHRRNPQREAADPT